METRRRGRWCGRRWGHSRWRIFTSSKPKQTEDFFQEGFPSSLTLLFSYFCDARGNFVCSSGTRCMNEHRTITTELLSTNKLTFHCNSQLGALLPPTPGNTNLNVFACQPGRGFSSELESNSYSWMLWGKLWSLTGNAAQACCSLQWESAVIRAAAGTPSCLQTERTWRLQGTSFNTCFPLQRVARLQAFALTYTKRHRQSGICIFKSQWDKKYETISDCKIKPLKFQRFTIGLLSTTSDAENTLPFVYFMYFLVLVTMNQKWYILLKIK